MKVKIIGAGSAGNHLAYASRQKKLSVFIVDNDPTALIRTREEIFPKRYGHWDDSIQLGAMDSFSDIHFDFVMIASPPEYHLELAINELTKNDLKYLLIEKPLCPVNDPHLEEFLKIYKKSSTEVFLAYNLNLIPASQKLIELLKQNRIGRAHTLNVSFREHISFPMNAHWWLKDISASYLSSSSKGGGACLEHSHAVSLWQYIAQNLGEGEITKVQSTVKTAKVGDSEYDEDCVLEASTSKGLRGKIHCDFLSSPPVKKAEIIGENGKIEWTLNKEDGVDVVDHHYNEHLESFKFPKKRSDDFIPQLEQLLQKEQEPNLLFPNTLESGLSVIEVIEASQRSQASGNIEFVKRERK